MGKIDWPKIFLRYQTNQPQGEPTVNVKIKARIAILTQYMTMLGFKDISINGRLVTQGAAPVFYRGTDEIPLERVDELKGAHAFGAPRFFTKLRITVKGFHTGCNQVLAVNNEIPLDLILNSSAPILAESLREAEECLHAALYEKAKGKAVIPAADLL